MLIRSPTAFIKHCLAAAFLILAVAGPARACSPPHVPPSSDAPLADWLEVEPHCLNDARFLGELGRRLNKAQRYGEASDRIERALMLAPNSGEFRLEYMVALVGIGDYLSAVGLADELLSDPELPRPLHALLTSRRSELLAPRWLRHASITLAGGYDTNLLGAPNLKSLDLTVGGQIYTLPLSDAYLAKGGRFARTDLHMNLSREDGAGGYLDIVGNLRWRASPDLPASNFGQIDLTVEHSRVRQTPGHYLSGGLAWMQGVGGGQFGILSLAGGWGAPRGHDCQMRAGAEVQERNYPVARLLDGRYWGIQAQYACYGVRSWAAMFKAGRDAPNSSERPGGDQNQFELRLTAYFPLLDGLLKLDADAAFIADTQGYSSLLDSGARRRVRRQMLRAEYARPAGKITWAAGLEFVNMASNIDLFRVRSLAPYLSARIDW